jgi:hypothetical protein
MKTIIQIMICRCGFITYNTCQRIRHLKSKDHLQFCKEMERKDKEPFINIKE